MTHTGLVPHRVVPTLPLWRSTTAGSLPHVATVPGNTTVSGRQSQSAAIPTMNGMPMPAGLPLALGWKTTRLHVVRTKTPMRPDLPHLLATMMIPTWLPAVTVVLALRREASMCLTTVLATGRWRRVFADWTYCIFFRSTIIFVDLLRQIPATSRIDFMGS